MDISRIRALCFDVDGTLRDTDDQFVQGLASLLHPVRRLLPRQNPQHFARRLVMGLEDPGTYLQGLADRLDIDAPLDWLSERLYRIRKGRRSTSPLLVTGVKEMLVALKARYPMAIVSMRGQSSTREFIEYYELGTFFEAMATSQTCRHTKPYPDPLIWAAGQMGVPPVACLMVGDTRADIRAGKAAGAQTVGVLCGFGEEKELRREGADLILKTTGELVNYLDL
jgi:phosphoglycolate phosphatase-like HAD superfamily hydrolase